MISRSFNGGFQITLLGELSATNSCLLMHSILVWIDGLKCNFENKNQFGYSRCLVNQGSNDWTAFYKTNVLVANGKKEFVQITEV